MPNFTDDVESPSGGTSKGAYIGVNGVARKIKKGYIGIDEEMYAPTLGTSLTIPFPALAGKYYGTNYTIDQEIGAAIINQDTLVSSVADLIGKWWSTSGTSVGSDSAETTTSASIATAVSYSGLNVQVELYDISLQVVGIARKIKKAYIGIGGVARPCWAGGELTYYGTATALSSSKYNLAATTVGDYALFGGGWTSTSSSGIQTVVDAYDTSLTRSTPTALSERKGSHAATTVGNYALFAGGYNGSSYSSIVNAYDTSLTRSIPSSMTIGKYYLAATTVGNYALFGGGMDINGSISSVVNAYDTSLTRSKPTSMQMGRWHLAATTVGNYALFGGGEYDNENSGRVDAYDTSLTKSNPTSLSVVRSRLAATTVGNYALFGGGESSSVVDAYNTSLTQSTATELSVARENLAATTVGNYALFGGGYKTDVVDAYDASLTLSIPTVLNTVRYNLAATTVGDYALFGGGETGSGYSSTVDVYTVA